MIRKIFPGSFNRPFVEEAQETEQLWEAEQVREFEAKQDRGRRRLRLLLISASIFAVLGVLLGVGYFSNIYRLDSATAKISVADGEAQVDEAQIRSTLAEFDGSHLLFLGRSRLVEKLKGIPEVGEISFDTSFTGDFSLAVTPGSAVVCIGKVDNCQAIDEAGRAFQIKPEFREKIAKLATLPKEVSTERLAADISRIRGALEQKFVNQITSFEVTAKRQYSFNFGEDKRVIWGVVGDDSVKAKLVTQMQAEPFKTLDLSNPNTPIAY